MKVLTNGEWLGRPECPYARRWVVDLGICSIRLHQWLHSDDPRYLHDHPWWFVAFVISGGYHDVSEQHVCRVCQAELHDGWCLSHEYDGEQRVWDHVGRFRLRYRSALHRHYVLPDPGGAWSILLTGKAKRRWGFWVKGRFRKSSRFFFDHGHPPCE